MSEWSRVNVENRVEANAKLPVLTENRMSLISGLRTRCKLAVILGKMTVPIYPRSNLL